MALVKYNDNSISAVTSTALAEGSLVPIKTLTASNSASLSFVDGSNDVVLDSTYPIYKFEFINIQSGDENAGFAFQVDTGTNTNYNQTITSTFFDAYHTESDSATDLRYLADRDQAQGSSLQPLTVLSSGGSDECENGTLHLYNPSSTTFVKHFMSRTSATAWNDYMHDTYVAGYGNTTSSIDAVQFSFSSGNIDSGTIKLYGIKDS